MALPSPTYFTLENHQQLLALWQSFPLLTAAIHRILRTTINYLVTRFFPTDPHSRPLTPLGASYLSNAKHTYRFVLTLCIFTHLSTVILTLFPTTIIPSSFSPPGAFLTLASQTPSSVFIPYSLFPSTHIPGLASGVQTLLQWDIYIGSTAFVLWAVLLYTNATTEKTIVDPNTSLPIYREVLVSERRGGDQGLEWKKLCWKVLGWGVVGGPIGAVAALLRERDAIVRQKIKQGL
jgi:hypothetical protein